MTESSPSNSEYRGGDRLPAWEVDTLPRPPVRGWNPLLLIGPGLMMAGAAIGGGEWLTGPANTAKYGGALMWLAGISILLQVFYNLEVIRYAAYCGESIFVGKFRLAPGPKFWTVVYLAVDFFGLWPYLSANAAVTLAAAFLGHLPAVLPHTYDTRMNDSAVVAFAKDNGIDEQEMLTVFHQKGERAAAAKRSKELKKEIYGLSWSSKNKTELATKKQEQDQLKQQLAYPPTIQKWVDGEKLLVTWLGIAIFMLAFLPLIFGGKVYKVLEMVMTIKIFIVLSYLIIVGLIYVSPYAWAEAFGGFIFLSRDFNPLDGSYGPWQFRLFPNIPEGAAPIDWALLGAFAAVAGQGGLNNAQFSSYARDKGWGMGQKVGAIPSLVGGRNLSLPHTGTCFEPTEQALLGWRAWMRHIARDQWIIWFVGCLLGMAIPSVISLHYQYRPIVAKIGEDASSGATAFALSSTIGNPIFWSLTLLCGFLVLAPNQISTTDGLVRRWTEVVWTGNKRLQRLPAGSVRYLYFGLLMAYALWGFIVLYFIGDRGMDILKIGACIMNFALGFSAWHTLVVNNVLLPPQVRPGWVNCIGLFLCGLFFIAIAAVGADALIRNGL